MLTYFIHVQYCFNYLVNQIPMGLLLYSHIPTSLMALMFGTYVLVKARNLPSFLFFSVCFIFTVWCAFDLSAWFSFLGPANTMFTWSLLDCMAVAMFFFTYYFLFTFLTGRDLPWWQKILGVTLLIPTTTIAYLGWNIPTYDLNACAALENSTYTIYTYYSEALFIIVTSIFLVIHYRRSKERVARVKTLLAGTGTLIFLGFFFSASFLVSLYASSSISTYVYNYLIYGLFGMPIFLMYLGYLIVRYHAFDLKVFGAQALIVILAILLASEFAFANNYINRILIAFTLIVTLAIGFMLIKSVRREIAQREHIEKLADELELTNQRQESLIHFVSHEVKGYLAKDMSAFAALASDDFGKLPATLKPFVDSALEQSRDGSRSVIDILEASNQKKGTVEYKKEPFDFSALSKEWFEKLKPLAEKKGIEMTFTQDEAAAPYIIVGDGPQIGDHVLRNIIENSINYTLQGKIHLLLLKKEGKTILTVADTGVGIAPEDRKRLFTEGGKGKDSLKVNVHSTGYGLFIAKNIIEAAGGTVRAESEGPGKGSQFIIELPSAPSVSLEKK